MYRRTILLQAESKPITIDDKKRYQSVSIPIGLEGRDIRPRAALKPPGQVVHDQPSRIHQLAVLLGNGLRTE